MVEWTFEREKEAARVVEGERQRGETKRRETERCKTQDAEKTRQGNCIVIAGWMTPRTGPSWLRVNRIGCTTEEPG